ncbi:MAG: ATP-binding protein [Turneriella sp.]
MSRKIILIAAFFSGSSVFAIHSPVIREGKLALTAAQLDQGPVELKGEWEFHWKKLASEVPLGRSPLEPAPTTVTVPKSWNGMVARGITVPAHGYATFRLNLALPDVPQRLAIRMNEQGTAFAVWINGRRIAERGRVGATAADTIPDTRPLVAFLGEVSGHTMIDLEIANFHYRKGGMWNAVEIGHEEVIRRESARAHSLEVFVAGTLLIIALYHFALYPYYRPGKPALIFAFFCLALFSVVTTGQRVLPEVFPGLQYGIYSQVEYLSWFFSIPLGIHYVDSMFQIIRGRRFIPLVYAIAAVFSLCLLFPPDLYSYTILPSNIILFGAASYAMLRLVLLIPQRPQGIRLFVFGALVLIAFTVNDILYIHEKFRLALLGPFGMLVFVLCQALVLSRRLLSIFQEKETLQKKLNENLLQNIRQKTDELRTAEEKSYQSREQFNNIVNNIPGLAYRCDALPPWSMRFLSEEMQRLTGFEASAFIGDARMKFSDLVRIEDRDARSEKIGSLTQQDPRYRMTYRLTGAKGEEIWVEDRGQQIFDTSGQALWLDGVMVDITLRKQFENAMLLAMEKAEQANKAKSQFLASMSHELRTPLHGVIGMVSLLNETELTEEQKSLLAVIESSGSNLLNLINQILDLAKVESGHMELLMEPVDIRLVVADIISLLTLTAREKGLNLLHECDANVPEFIVSDQTKIRQIILNLTGNALKFTNKGTVLVRITASDHRKGKILLKFAIRDTGIGLSEPELERIFLPFMQADSSTARKFGGTGLGLTISKQLVEKMGGFLWVESKLGEGSEFSFALPVKIAEQSVASNRAEGESLVVAPALDTRRCILVADDDEINREISMRMLKNLGYDVVVAENGKEAVVKAFSAAPDLILMDCMMPEMDGYEATIEIRKRSDEVRTRRLPIIALSANAMKSDQDRCMSAGLDDFISKPFKQAELAAKISRWLN